MDESEYISLPVATSLVSDYGPQLSWREGKLLVAYDHLGSSGSQAFARVTFTHVQSFRFLTEAACAADDILDFNVMLQSRDSNWLNDISQRRRAFLGQAPDKLQITHYAIYFDHFGRLDVAAVSHVIESPLPSDQM